MADKSALITGASGGIGRAFAVALAREGYSVTVVARSQDKLAALVEELGPGHAALPADLSTPEGIERIASAISEGGFDLVVNNAGVGTYRTFHEVDLARTQAMLRLNIDALVTLSHAFLAGATSGGALINVSSALSFMPMPFAAAYSASKAFVTSFSETLWYENKDRGVYVMGLLPGVTDTGFHDAAGGAAGAPPPRILTQSPEAVVDTALAALRRRSQPVVISGWLNEAGNVQSRLLPRKWMVSLMGQNAPVK